MRLASSAAQRNVLAPRLASTRASLSGLPPSAAMMRAICSAFSSMRCDVRSRIAARFHAGVQRNASAATRARSRTTSMSSRVAVGTRASSAPSHGARSVMGSPVPYGPLMTRSGATLSLTRIPEMSLAVVLMILPLLRLHAGQERLRPLLCRRAYPAGPAGSRAADGGAPPAGPCLFPPADGTAARAPALPAPSPRPPRPGRDVTACSSRRTGPRPRPSSSRPCGTGAGR